MLGIIDYGMGNIQSVVNAFEYLSIPTKIVKDKEELFGVDKIVLPGVGAFGEGIQKLRVKGFYEYLNRGVLEDKKPFLGICLGMQLICKESFEFGHFEGLGWIDASVRRFDSVLNLRIPHVGWNNLTIKRPNRIIAKSNEDESLDVYFVHSYYVDTLSTEFCVASCKYGIEFCAAIEKNNIFATQFHPEKSQRIGLEILKRFSEI